MIHYFSGWLLRYCSSLWPVAYCLFEHQEHGYRNQGYFWPVERQLRAASINCLWRVECYSSRKRSIFWLVWPVAAVGSAGAKSCRRRYLHEVMLKPTPTDIWEVDRSGYLIKICGGGLWPGGDYLWYIEFNSLVYRKLSSQIWQLVERFEQIYLSDKVSRVKTDKNKTVFPLQ